MCSILGMWSHSTGGRAWLVAWGLLLLGGGARAAVGDHVVQPGGLVALARAVHDETAKPWPGGLTFDEIVARPTSVRVSFSRPEGGGTGLTLLHPSLAPDDAVRAAGVAMIADAGAPEGLIEALVARLGDSEAVVWQLDEGDATGSTGAPSARGEAPAPAPEPRLDVEELSRRVEHLVKRGEPGVARAELDALDPDARRSDAQRVVLASLYVLAGDRAAAQRMIDGIEDPGLAPELMAIREPDATPEGLLGDRAGAEACAAVDVATTLRRVGREDAVAPFLRAVLARAPDCAAASEPLAVALVRAGRGEEALAVADAALAHAPDNDALRFIRVSALQQNGRLGDAIEGLEALVRGPGRKPGRLGLLLAMYLREQRVQARLDYWLDAAAQDPADPVARFMVGVLLHYQNRFAESDQWLMPLFEELPDEPRVYVYHAMNQFNLGHPDRARSLLDQAAALPVVDPDVYYCRAEVTRDTDRDLAIADFERFLSMIRGQALGNPAKEARVETMLAALKRCKASGDEVCDGPWEHPRLRGWRAPWVLPTLIGAAIALCAGALLLAVRRRRRKTPLGAA
ncbi:MAG: hypothetical protein H6744_08195 [Deltaproteobacteria bacterium]|nr:hypothetical protein [Deltaproteobacteria bacterium]MCB9786658.1 hypothetical protein [Deltaproteobacteria bacterium]